MPSIAAVVVTYNRVELLLECIAGLLAQTRPLDHILLIDNASTDGTAERLQASGLLDHPKIEYVALPANIGGAGGFHEGLHLASEAGYDWIWLMDDDAEPEPDCLEKMAAAFAEESAVLVAPAVVNGDGQRDDPAAHRARLLPSSEATFYRFSSPLHLKHCVGRDIVPIDVCSFVGPCIKRSAIAEAGLPKKEFFIHQDDIEYSLRLGKVGRLLLVPGARIRHKKEDGPATAEGARGLFGKRQRTPFNKLWPLYYGYRNTVWMTARGLLPTRFSRTLLLHARVLAGTILFDDRKWDRLRFWSCAFWDGYRGRFENARPRQLAPPR